MLFVLNLVVRAKVSVSIHFDSQIRLELNIKCLYLINKNLHDYFVKIAYKLNE